MIKKLKLLAILTLFGCSSTHDNPDPHKEFNKDMLELNLTIDKNILKPTAVAYKDVTPDVAQKSISNFLINWKEPYYCLNYIVTLDAEQAANSLFRFVINSTFGILGLFDVAEQIDLKKAETSYKNTLKKIGVPTGDYLVLPILGFSSTRDIIAEPISWFADPVGYFIGIPYMIAKAIIYEINYRAENADFIDSTIKDSMDLYSTTKEMYIQRYDVTPSNQKETVDDSPSPDQIY